MDRHNIFFYVLVFFCISVMPAHATLIDIGGGLIYDDVLDVTWLQDANYAKTSGYNADGLMTWSEAQAWAGGLSYYDSVRDVVLDDWILPTTPGTINGPLNEGDLGHLYFEEGVTPATPGPFVNLQAGKYWTDTPYSLDPNKAWGFDFVVGGPCVSAIDERTSIMPYRPRKPPFHGPITPEPSSFILIGTGLSGLLVLTKGKAKHHKP